MKALGLFLTICLVCVGITLYVSHLDRTYASMRDFSTTAENYADAEFRSAIIRITDEKGKQLYLTHTPKITHYTDNSIEITSPVIIVQQDADETPWRLAADKAMLNSDLKQAFLHGTVYADREASMANNATHLSSEDVTIDYQKKYAHSDAFTIIESGQQRTTGMGMEIWFEKPTKVRLLSNVRSTFIR